MEVNTELLGQQILAGDKNVHQVEVNFLSVSGKKYEGMVTFKRPNMKDYLTMGIEKARYLQSQMGENFVHPDYIDGTVQFLAHMLSVFKVNVVTCPQWFLDPTKIEDFDLLNYVFDQYEVWVNSFRKPGKGTHKGSSERPIPEEVKVD